MTQISRFAAAFSTDTQTVHKTPENTAGTTNTTQTVQRQRHWGCDILPEKETRSSAETLWVRRPPERETRSSAETLWLRRPPPAACKQGAVQRHCGCEVPPPHHLVWETNFGDDDPCTWRMDNMTPPPPGNHRPACRGKPLKCDSLTGRCTTRLVCVDDALNHLISSPCGWGGGGNKRAISSAKRSHT